MRLPFVHLVQIGDLLFVGLVHGFFSPDSVGDGLPDAEAGSYLGDHLVVPGYSVASAKFGPRHLVFLVAHISRRDLFVLVEVALERVARSEDLHYPHGIGAAVVEGVRYTPRLDDVGAGRGNHDLASDVARQFAL